jgi:hypothetical protein
VSQFVEERGSPTEGSIGVGVKVKFMVSFKDMNDEAFNSDSVKIRTRDAALLASCLVAPSYEGLG